MSSASSGRVAVPVLSWWSWTCWTSSMPRVSSQESVTQPAPCSAIAAALNWLRSDSRLPKESRMAASSDPPGSAPSLGSRLRQKIECSTWPDRWKARSVSTWLMRLKSPMARIAASVSSARLAPST
jgi:hypothetical protein